MKKEVSKYVVPTFKLNVNKVDKMKENAIFNKLGVFSMPKKVI